MKHLAITVTASAILLTSAVAQKIGVTLSAFEHQFLVKVRETMTEKAKELGVQIQFVEAQGDIGRQLNQNSNRSLKWRRVISMSPSSRTPRVRARARWKLQSNSSKARKVESFVWIPFELVTADNYKEYLKK